MSIFTGGEVNVAEFPATSVTVTAPVTAEPSTVSTSGLPAGLVEATPERLSAVVKGKLTLALFQPDALAGDPRTLATRTARGS